ncbi:MAG: hypothetical protein LBG21_03630 [Campylobacteraceae bacterium]|nr:hypothetical protein [Campylobacteraceae bacterium]
MPTLFISLIFAILLGGCANPPNPPNPPNPTELTEEYAFSFEKQYMDEAQQMIAQHNSQKSIFKWIQPVNKKESCKVYTGVSADDNSIKKRILNYFGTAGAKTATLTVWAERLR